MTLSVSGSDCQAETSQTLTQAHLNTFKIQVRKPSTTRERCTRRENDEGMQAVIREAVPSSIPSPHSLDHAGLHLDFCAGLNRLVRLEVEDLDHPLLPAPG
jgi:hypothetical protein